MYIAEGAVLGERDNRNEKESVMLKQQDLKVLSNSITINISSGYIHKYTIL
jgi:hypothetical protein